MNNKISAVTRGGLLLTLGVLAAAGAAAQNLVNARVLSSPPIWQQVPVSGCAPGVRPSGVGTAVGALVGGLIGSQLGSGSGHIAGAILGTVGGAMLGNAADAQAGHYGGGCATRYENRLSGYDVTYEYAGRTQRTQMAQDPGPWLQIPAPVGWAEPDYGGNYGSAYGGGYGGVPSYPVPPAPMAGYPLPVYPAAGESSGVVTAPPYGGGYPTPYAGPYAPAYPPQAQVQSYPVPAYPAPVYARPAPRYVTPVGVSLSIGGVIGGRGRGHWSVGVGSPW